MSIDFCDEVGWPAAPTRVYPTEPGYRAEWRTASWRARRNLTRRERYRRARMEGYDIETARAMSQGRDW